MKRSKPAVAVLGSTALILAACSSETGDETSSDGIQVTTSIYPLEYVAEEVGGDHVSVTSLTPPGSDDHSLELSPRQVNNLSNVDLVVTLSGYQAAMDDALGAAEVSRVIDAADHIELIEDIDHSGHDHSGDVAEEQEASQDAHDAASEEAEAHEDHDHADEEDHEGHDHSEEGSSDDVNPTEDDHSDHDHANEDTTTEDDHSDHDHESEVTDDAAAAQESLQDAHDAASEEAEEHSHDGHDHSGPDPHFWLDPTQLALLAEPVAEQLAEIDPDNADEYRANAEQLIADMEALDGDFHEGLAQCESDTFVVSHEAFGYLANAYDLDQQGIAGLEIDTEPSPRRVAEVTALIEEAGVSLIFATSEAEMSVTGALAEEAGVDVDILDAGATQLDENVDYEALMRTNLDKLQNALDCR